MNNSQRTNKKININANLFHLTTNAILTAVIIIMSFTPIGYLKIGTVAITFITVPVAIGAIISGPISGAVLGGIFGLTSFIQCFGIDPFGTALLNINLIYTLLMCFVPRILTGLLSGLVFKFLSKADKTNLISYVITCLSCSVMNTIFFMASLMVLFGSSDYIKSIMDALGQTNVILFMFALVGINALIEIIVNSLISAAISKSLAIIIKKQKAKYN